MEIVTYANKSQGRFEDLMNNEFGVPVKVLGWGTKWGGYSDKSKGVLEYMKTKNDNDIVIFIDGFDTRINKSPEKVLELFKKCDCRVLLSSDPNISGTFFTSMIFGHCKGSGTANAGMYMGYVKELTTLLQGEANLKCSDDQVNLNQLCRKYDFVKVDKDEKIFKNFGPLDKRIETDAIFVSFPGSPSVSRYSRALFEYTQFVYMYVLCALILGIGIFPKYSGVLFTSMLLFLTFYTFFADKSCTT